MGWFPKINFRKYLWQKIEEMLMVNKKQLDRLTLKISRLLDVYSEYLVIECEEQEVLLDGERIRLGERWGKEFGYGNFTFRYRRRLKNPYLFVNDGGVEHLVKADGKPFGMIDWLEQGKDAIFRCHKYVSLTDIPDGAEITIEAYASHTFYGTMPFEKKQTFSVAGYMPERIYKGIFVVEIDEELKVFLSDLRLFCSYFRSMDEGDVNKADAYELFEQLFSILSPEPSVRPEAEDIRAADKLLKEYFNKLAGGNRKNLPYVGVVGHSHLDTAWLWTMEETRRKAARTVANAITLLKRYPDYRFIMSSALHLDWIKTDYPEVFQEVQALTSTGRFEPNGAAWVECDCNITDGESLIRQFLKGKTFLRENLHFESDVFWLPDTFGYSAALPQIMKGCGVPYFLTTKLSWNDTNKFPYESFRWKGIDGSEVIVHFNTIQSRSDPEFIASRLEKRQNKHLTKNVLIAYGYGDGGGGPDADMVAEALTTEQTYPYAEVKHTSVSDFMKKLETEEQLPLYEGELYLELHRGTLTTNSEVKRLNRRLEGALKDWEILSVGTGKKELLPVIENGWATLMTNQFHDILPGTCIREVNEDAVKRNAEALNMLDSLCDGRGEYFNTLSFARTEILPSESGVQIYEDVEGKKIALDVFDFAPYSYGVKRRCETSPFSFDGENICTPFCTARIKRGKLLSLVFNGREFASGTLNDIRLYKDVPYLWDNWDIDADYTQKVCPVEAGESRLISSGPLQLRLRTEYSLAGKSQLTQDIVFNAFSPTIMFENVVDWEDEHKLLRAEFETNLSASSYRSEIQFGYIERSTTRNTSEEQAKYEVCNHKWTDLSEPGGGLSLLNDCKYGVSVERGKIGLSLIKSGKRPDIIGERGIRKFSYALLPHKGGFSAETTILPAYTLNRRPIKYPQGVCVPVVGVSEPNVIVEAIKFAERGKGIILRLYECERSLTECVLRLSEDFNVYQCDMLEENPIFLGKGKNIRLHFRQFEIKTLLIDR